MDHRIDAGGAQEDRQQRRRGGAVDVIVAENCDPLATHSSVGHAVRRALHVGETIGIGHQPFERGVEKGFDAIDLDIAPGEDAGEQFRQPVALRDGERARMPAVVESVAPPPPGR